MRPTPEPGVFWRARAVASLIAIALTAEACGSGNAPSQPSPPTQTVPSAADVAGVWHGGISLWSFDGDTGHISLTLTQTGNSFSGTFECLYRCVDSTGSITGTIDGTTLTARIVFPDGRSCDRFEGTMTAQGLSGRYACALPIAKDGTVHGSWTAARILPSQCVPVLISPAHHESVDNGRIDRRDRVTWDFSWTDCPGARYHIIISNAKAMYPVLDARDVDQPSYRRDACGSYVIGDNRSGWRWRVRASVSGAWGNWSSEGAFDVEPLDSDPPTEC